MNVLRTKNKDNIHIYVYATNEKTCAIAYRN